MCVQSAECAQQTLAQLASINSQYAELVKALVQVSVCLCTLQLVACI